MLLSPAENAVEPKKNSLKPYQLGGIPRKDVDLTQQTLNNCCEPNLGKCTHQALAPIPFSYHLIAIEICIYI